MADTLARLDIQITSTAKSSMDAINAVQQKVEGLSRAMTGLSSPWVTSTLTNLSSSLKTFSNDVKGVDTKGLSSITRAIDSLGTAASKLSFASSAAKNLDALAVSLQHISTMEFGDLSNLTRFLSSVAKVSGAATGSAGGAISSLTTSLSGLAAAGPMDFSDIIKLVNSVKKLDATASTNLTQLATALSGFSGIAISDLSGLNSLINSITRLSASTFDPTIFKRIGDAVAQLATRLRRAPEVSQNLIKLLSALARFGGSSMASAPANIDAVGNAIARMVTYLDALPAMHEDIVRFVEAIAAIAPHMRSMSSAVTSAGRSMSIFDVIIKAAKDTFKQFGNIGKKVIGIWKDVTKTFSGGKGFLSGPVGSLLRFAATFLTLQRAWEALKSSISNASALVEIQNVINAVYSSGERAFESMSGGAQTAAEHLDELAKGAVHAYGMSELAFKEYASQFQAMGTALGITNEQVAAAEENLDKWGVMVSKVKDPVTGINKEFGVMTGQMSDLSFTMTQLAGDIASFYDKDVADVQKALASGIYAGQTRPLRQFGLDITQANVQAWALRQGLEANMQTMTQGEKVMLRYQYILSNLGFVMGDFAYTADTFANRWRVMQQQMTQFGATVGTIFVNAFKPVLRVLNRVMDAAIQFAETVLNALGAIFGWTYEISAAGISDDLGLGEMADDMGDVASGAGDTASGLGDAAKNAAKLKTQLQSFDKLNNLTSPGGSGSGGSGGSGGGGGGGGGGGTSGGSGAISIARHTGEGIVKAYESTIDSLFGLGEYISTSLRDALRNINWESIYSEARSFGTGLASFLNGLIRPDTFYEVGKTVANSLNTAMEFFFGLGDVFSFKNLGVSIRNALMGFFKNFNWDLAKANIGVWLEGLAETINNLITPDLFKEIGTFLSNAVNTAFHGMKKFFIKLDGKNIGVSIAQGANSFIEGLDADEIADAINEAIRDVKDAVISFATTLDWGAAWSKAKEVLEKLDIPVVELVIGAFAASLAAKVALGVGALAVGKHVLGWLGASVVGNTGLATATAATGSVAGVAGTSGLVSVAIPLALTAVAAGALEFIAPDKDTAGAKVWHDMMNELLVDPSDPGNAAWNVPVEVTVDKDAFDKSIYELLGIKEEADQFFRDHPILAKVFGYKFEDHIPNEGKVLTDAKVQAQSATWQKGANKSLPDGHFYAKQVNWQKGANHNLTEAKIQARSATWQKGANRTIPDGNMNTVKVKRAVKAPGFTGFSMSGTVRGGGGKVIMAVKEAGGVFSHGKWSKIPQFADGGVPSITHGSVFLAGESGPEVVGHIGSRTEVLNASQIAAAVSDGVARANNSVVNALAAQNRILVGILEKKTGISSRDIFSAVRAEAANYQLRTGTPAFQ